MSSQKEVILNKPFKFNNKNAVLAKIKFMKKTCELITIHDSPAPNYNYLLTQTERYITQREYLKRNFDFSPATSNIDKFIVKGHTIVCHSHRITPLSETPELEIFLGNITQTDISQISVRTSKFSKSQLPHGVDLAHETDIVLKTKPRYGFFAYIGQPFTLSLTEPLPDIRRSFVDKTTGTEHYFYINSINRIDLEKEYEEITLAHNETLPQDKKMTDKQLAQAKEIYMTTMLEQCPAEKDLYCLKYESEDDWQLDFYESTFLDEIKDLSNPLGAVGTATIFDYNEQLETPHGFGLKIARIPIPKNIQNNVALELFSSYSFADGETIKIATSC